MLSCTSQRNAGSVPQVLNSRKVWRRLSRKVGCNLLLKQGKFRSIWALACRNTVSPRAAAPVFFSEAIWPHAFWYWHSSDSVGKGLTPYLPLLLVDKEQWRQRIESWMTGPQCWGQWICLLLFLLPLRNMLTKETEDLASHLDWTLFMRLSSGFGKTKRTLLRTLFLLEHHPRMHFLSICPVTHQLWLPVGFIRSGKWLLLSLLLNNIIILNFWVSSGLGVN